MTTVLVVHGTGVRKDQYEQTFDRVVQKLLALHPDLKIERCLWGDAYGIRKINGDSIPLKDGKLALGQEKEDDEIVLWEQLYGDPLYELRVLSLKPVEGSAVSPWLQKPGDELKSQLQSLSPSPELQAKLAEALELRKRRLGQQHPDVATSLNNLAGLYYSQGRYDQAEPLYQEALEIAERWLGENHPNTVIFRKNLQYLRDNRQP